MMHSTITMGTASQATPRGCSLVSRGGRVLSDNQTIASQTPWPIGHNIPDEVVSLCFAWLELFARVLQKKYRHVQLFQKHSSAG